MTKVSTLLFILLLGVGCHSTDPTPEEELKAADTVTNVRINFDKLPGKWAFTGYLKDKTVPANGEATLEFTATEKANTLQVGGRAFVNLYGSTFSYDEAKSTIQLIEPVSTTKMAGTPEMMKAESNFLNNLKNVTKFSVEGANLKLYVGEPASEIMYFKK
jgi:heat shock protein HslJ